MAGPCFPAGVQRAATSSRSATNVRFASRNSISIPVATSRFGFPKSARILRRGDFRKVYDEGVRQTCPLFAAFLLQRPEQSDGPKVGFTVPRAMGKAVVRNRMKRRMREAVRHRLSLLPPQWCVVFNPRKPLLHTSMSDVLQAVERLFAQCANS